MVLVSFVRRLEIPFSAKADGGTAEGCLVQATPNVQLSRLSCSLHIQGQVSPAHVLHALILADHQASCQLWEGLPPPHFQRLLVLEPDPRPDTVVLSCKRREETRLISERKVKRTLSILAKEP